MPAWEAHDPTLTRPAARWSNAPSCSALTWTLSARRPPTLSPIRVDGAKVWSLMQLERHLHPDAYGRVRGGYIARRRPRATGTMRR
jgi:hypothetical protein